MKDNNLPIYDVLSEVLYHLNTDNRLVLQAPPGAGKTTSIPLELLNEPWLDGKKIIMLEPRRIAVRNAAYWMSKTLDMEVGRTIGYSVHLDKKVTSETKIEVVTEGVFINRLLKDPELKDVAIVIFDEFHERSLDADLGLTLVKEVQEVLRDDLKILVMSATLDAEPVANYLNNAPIVTSKGKSFPVKIKYVSAKSNNIIKNVISTVIDVINNEDGSILVFLPGVGEIKRVRDDLKTILPEEILIQPLYSGLPRDEQERAIEDDPKGRRKVVLSTSIAESSITIKGVTVVVDSGLIRKPQYNPKNGMNNLETLHVSKASADQRTGRAGRIEPGVCYRLWDSFKTLDEFDTPEIRRADFSSGLLTLNKWGYRDIDDVEWLTPPNRSIYQSCQELLKTLGAIDENGITKKGEELSSLPFHPRIASIISSSRSHIAVTLAALLSEKDILIFSDGNQQVDIRYRLEVLEGKSVPAARKQYNTINRVKEVIKSIISTRSAVDIPELLLNSFPDRIAKKTTHGTYYMSNGKDVILPDYDSLYSSEYLVVTNSGGLGRVDKIYLAYPITEEDIYNYCKKRIEEVLEIEYLRDKNKFTANKRLKIGHLVIKESRTNKVSDDDFHTALISYLKKNGLKDLKWTKQSISFVERVKFLHNHYPDDFPNFNENNLIQSLEWLKPYIGALSIQNSLNDIPLLDALKGFFDWNTLKKIESLTPTHLIVPSGSNIPIDYSTGEPILKVRLQELFGLLETPKICNGLVLITFHLLSPASRPIQITKDLKSFWTNTYISVKKDLMGRYPKHYWPEDPLVAIPTSRVKRKKQY